jgi:hypothetical protein
MDRYTKAVMAALVMFAGQYSFAIGEHTPGGTTVVGSEWILGGVAALVAALAVWAVPNDRPPAT